MIKVHLFLGVYIDDAHDTAPGVLDVSLVPPLVAGLRDEGVVGVGDVCGPAACIQDGSPGLIQISPHVDVSLNADKNEITLGAVLFMKIQFENFKIMFLNS